MISDYLKNLIKESNEEFLEELQEDKILINRIRSKASDNPEKFKLATDALNTLKEMEKDLLKELNE